MQALEEQCPAARELSHSLRDYAHMLDELRVSLFAQHLGTSRPVSPKRLRAQWAAVESWFGATGGREREA
jgi:ATP-dependent helicase HrpA